MSDHKRELKSILRATDCHDLRTRALARALAPPKQWGIRRVRFADTDSPSPEDRTVYAKEYHPLMRIRELERKNKILEEDLEKEREENERLSTMVRPEVPVQIDASRESAINDFLTKTTLWTDNALAQAFVQLKRWVGKLREELGRGHHLLPALNHWHTNHFRRYCRIYFYQIDGQYEMTWTQRQEGPPEQGAITNEEYREALMNNEDIDELVVLYVQLEKYRDDPDICLDIRDMLTLIMKIRHASPNMRYDLCTYQSVKAIRDGSLAIKIRAERLNNLTRDYCLVGNHLGVLFAVAQLSLLGIGMDDLQQVRDICTEIAIWANLEEGSRSKDDPLQIRTRLVYEVASSLIVHVMHSICCRNDNMERPSERVHEDWNRAKIGASIAEAQFLLGSAYTDCFRLVVNNRDPEPDFEPALLFTHIQRKERIIASLDDIPHCTVCLRTWDDRKQRAVLSSCSHSVCQECRDQLDEMNQPNCPECRSANFANNTYRNRALEEATMNVLTWREKAEKLEKQLKKEIILKHFARKAVVHSRCSAKKAKTDAQCRLKKTIEGNAKMTRKYYQLSLRRLRSSKLSVPPDAKPPAKRTIRKQPSLRKR